MEGAGDLDGDGKTDLVWRNTSTSDTYTWKMNGAAIVAAGSLGIVP